MVNYMKNKDQFYVSRRNQHTNNAGFSDLASSMLEAWVAAVERMVCLADGTELPHRPNAGGNFSKQFKPNLKFGGNVRYGYTDNDVLSGVFTQNLLSAGNTLEEENNTANNKSQNFNLDLRLEWDPDTLTKIIFRPEISFYNNNRRETGDFLTVSELAGDTINHGESDIFPKARARISSFGSMPVVNWAKKAGY